VDNPGELSKNGLDHRVPLSAQALRILKDLRNITEKSKSKWVFPSTRETGPHINHAQKAIERIVKRSGVEFRGHDLRRTSASLMVGAGVPRLVVSKILNHVETGVTSVYDRHSYDQEKRSALDFWGRRLEAILANKRDAKVLTFEARRRRVRVQRRDRHVRRGTDQAANGCRQRRPAKRAKSLSVVISSHPCSIASAARYASATSGPRMFAHSVVKISQWRRLGTTMTARGQSTSR
jgi:hypothetical protein